MKRDTLMTNIFDTILKTKEFEIIATAIQIIDLDRTLDRADNFTIFAPNNRAFTSLPKIRLQNLSQDIPLLTKILSAHIVYGKLTHQELLRIYDLGERKIIRRSIDGAQLDIDLNNGIKIGDSTILSTGISADNGIIYPIDRVIMPARSANCQHILQI